MRNRYSVVIVIFLTLIINGCSDDNDPTGPSSAMGEWSATVTGEFEMELSGEAVFNSQGFDVVTGVPGLLVTLSSIEPEMGLGVFIVFPGNSQLSQAEYSVGEYDTDPEILFEQDLNPDRVYAQVILPETLFFSSSGSVRITRSESNALAGIFELTARTTDFEGEGERSVEISGDFAAFGI